MPYEMAILQEVDKCVRCNGCVISCKRTWQMKGDVSRDVPHDKLAPNQRVVIKSQKRVDNGPFVRFSCWHCDNPPCAGRCPFKAIKKHPVTGAVYIDPRLCKPEENACHLQCKADCQRGGVPMIGAGCDFTDQTSAKAWKCTLCTGVDEAGVQFGPYKGAGEGGDLPTKAPLTGGVFKSQLSLGGGATLPDSGEIKELAHQPSCVFTCPAKAMVWDTKANIIAYLEDSTKGWQSHFGDGSMYWVSKKYLVAPPKADPFIEDHISPMVSSLLSSPFAKAALAPTLVAGAVLAIAARRAKMDEELSIAGEER